MAYRLPGGKDTSNDFSNALGQAVQGYTQNKKMEAARAVINNPDSTPIQQALALAELGQEKLGSDYYKGSLREAETAALQGAYGGQRQQQEAPRDRSWIPDMSGRTPPIRDAGPASVAQPGQEGSPSQPVFSVSGPQSAARNDTALNMPQTGGSPQGIPKGMPPQTQGMPQPQQVDPIAQAAQLRNQAGQMNIIRPGSGNALLSQADSLEKRALAEQRLKRDTYESEKSYSTQLTEGFRKEIEGLRQSNPIKEQAIALARDALSSGDVGFFSGSNLAKRTGIEAFESPAGAGLNLAAKEFLVGNLSQVTARAQNKWLEQIMSSAFPRVGQSEAANNTVMEGVQAAYDLGKAKENIATQLEQEDLHNLGYIGKDIAYRTEEALKPEAERIMNRLSYRTKVQSENEKSEADLIKKMNKKALPGTYLTRRMFNVMARKFNGDTTKAIIHAKQLGYKIPTNEQIDEWIE